MSPVAFVDANVPIYAAGRAHPFFWVGPGSRPGQGWIGLACGLSSDTGTGPPTGVTRDKEFASGTPPSLVDDLFVVPVHPARGGPTGPGSARGPLPAALRSMARFRHTLSGAAWFASGHHRRSGICSPAGLRRRHRPPSLETPNLFCGGQRISGCNGVPPCLRPNIPGGIRLVCEEYSGPVPRYPSFAYTDAGSLPVDVGQSWSGPSGLACTVAPSRASHHPKLGFKFLKSCT